MLSARELTPKDISLIADYWANADEGFLLSMGVDKNKMPTKEQFTAMLTQQLAKPIEERNAFCLIWESEGEPIGHCNTNPTYYGDHAFMHLHIWKPDLRTKGKGAELVKLSLPHFFEKLKLRKLYSQPYAQNIAPNRTLAKAGFELIEELVTIPGSINFEQPVKRWEMSLERYNAIRQLP